MRRRITAWRLSLKRARFEAAQTPSAAPVPVAVTVHPDGSAIAHFAGGRDLYFCDLAHLLLAHALSLEDFDELAGDDPAG